MTRESSAESERACTRGSVIRGVNQSETHFRLDQSKGSGRSSNNNIWLIREKCPDHVVLFTFKCAE